MTTKDYDYTVTKKTVTVAGIGETELYGIATVDNTRSGEVMESADDVFESREEAERVCRLIKREKLEPVHLLDFIRDYIDGGRELIYGKRSKQ